MAKRQSRGSPAGGTDAEGRDTGSRAQGAAEGVPESDEVRQAEEAVRRAREELEKACRWYEQVRRQAVDQVRQVREARVGDVLDGILDFVRRHPGPGLILAVLAGFFLGRLFRR